MGFSSDLKEAILRQVRRQFELIVKSDISNEFSALLIFRNPCFE